MSEIAAALIAYVIEASVEDEATKSWWSREWSTPQRIGRCGSTISAGKPATSAAYRRIAFEVSAAVRERIPAR